MPGADRIVFLVSTSSILDDPSIQQYVANCSEKAEFIVILRSDFPEPLREHAKHVAINLLTHICGLDEPEKHVTFVDDTLTWTERGEENGSSRTALPVDRAVAAKMILGVAGAGASNLRLVIASDVPAPVAAVFTFAAIAITSAGYAKITVEIPALRTVLDPSDIVDYLSLTPSARQLLKEVVSWPGYKVDFYVHFRGVLPRSTAYVAAKELEQMGFIRRRSEWSGRLVPTDRAERLL